jgi:hypothetical protein
MGTLAKLIKAFIGAALLNKAVRNVFIAMMKGREDSPGVSRKKQKDQIIDLDEYTIVDDKR